MQSCCDADQGDIYDNRVSQGSKEGWSTIKTLALDF